MRRLRDDEGAVTAEFALTIPAVIAVLGIVLGGVYLAAERIALVSIAGDVARLEARGDTALATARIAEENRAPTLTRETGTGILCVTATAAPRFGILSSITISGRGCAALAATER